MPENPPHDFKVSALDPAILSSPYQVHTNWHVITGAPCCGKTTLIGQLAEEGYQTVPETARVYFDVEIAKGRTIPEILADKPGTQRGIEEMQLSIEDALNPEDTVFLDRGLPDCLSWHRNAGLDPNELLPKCFRRRYASVFVLDLLPFVGDGAREYDTAEVDYLDKQIASDYGALGYGVVRVPVLPPPDRLAFVLEWLSEGGLI
jgi:predicted ATPase